MTALDRIRPDLLELASDWRERASRIADGDETPTAAQVAEQCARDLEWLLREVKP